MHFKHPLARDAKVWTSNLSNGQEHRLLVIVTTLVLDARHKKFKSDKVARLRDVAREWITAHPTEADGFLLMNRVKDWESVEALGNDGPSPDETPAP